MADTRQPRIRRLGRLALFCWCAGLLVTLLVAFALGIFAEPQAAGIDEVTGSQGEETQTIRIQQRPGSMRVTLDRKFGENWSPMRAAGPPDTLRMGDITTAWASLTQDDQVEWLELSYPTPMQATKVRVHETYCPGALIRVTAFDNQGQEIDVWHGVDPAAPNADRIYVAEVPVSMTFPTSRIRIYLDSPKVRGWNEIDAVGLVDGSGNVQWAEDVRASTTYAIRYYGNTTTINTIGGIANKTTGTFSSLEGVAPAWTGFPLPPRARGPYSNLNRVVEARGWPMLALWADVPPAAQQLEPGRLYHPIWLGLLADSAMYGAALWLLYVMTFGLRQFVQESLRLRRGCCMKCGYDLRFDIARGCPECGWRRVATETCSAPQLRSR